MGIATGVLAADNELLKELKTLQLQARQLERDAREYRSLIEMLENDPSAGSSKQNALLALQNQLERAEVRLEEISRRRAELEKTLSSQAVDADARQTGQAALAERAPAKKKQAKVDRGGADPAGAPQAASEPAGGEPAAQEAARLAELLSGYYGDANGTEGGRGRAGGSTEPGASGLDVNKVRLNGREGRLAIDLIAERLARGPQSTRREADVVFYVEVRHDGRLVSTSSYSLKSLGKAQYITKIALQSGEATIRVRRDDWTVKLDGAQEAEYIVTLDMPEYGEASLHVIPVEELREAGIEDPPLWLPFLGDAPPDSS